MDTTAIKFIFAYARLGDIKKAAEEEGIDAIRAHEILQNPIYIELLEVRKDELIATAMVTKEGLLKEWYDIKHADATKAINVKRVNCRYCNGVGNKYQWTYQEWTGAYERAVCNKNTDIKAPDYAGGVGFNPWGTPNTLCTECGGLGEERVFVESFDKLPLNVRKSITSIEAKKDGGIKINFRDKDKASDSMAKYLGMFVDHQHITGNLGVSKAVEDMSDEELLAIAATAHDSP